MAENVLSLLINERLELESQRKEITLKLEEVEHKILLCMTKNGLEKAENEYFRLSLRESKKLVWIDEEAGKKQLAKDGLLSQYLNETFNAAGFKKYLEDHPDYDAGGNLELSSEKKVSITAKR